MNNSRREFLVSSALLSTALLTSYKKSFAQNSPRDLRLPILQGATSLNATQINILSDKNIHIQVLASNGTNYSDSVEMEKVQKAYSPWAAYRLFISNLDSNLDYVLEVRDEKGSVIDTRTFRTLRPEVKHARIALASCMRDNKVEEQKRMWASLEASDPDLLFLLGDNVYVDDGESGKGDVTAKKIWTRYVETRRTLDLYKLPKLIPTLATWDDHDFGENNTYGNRYWKEESQEIFRTLYAQDAVMQEVSWGPGIATCFEAYGQRFFMMDDRSFRDNRWVGYSHWGPTQEDWLFSKINKSTKPSWLFNGSQFFGAYRMGWSFEGNHPEAFRYLLNRLKKVSSPIVFGSGDVHYSEVMKIEKNILGYETLEITSSSMHSNAKPPVKGNRRRMLATGEYNFVIADVELTERTFNLQVRSMGEKSRELFNLDSFEIQY